MSRSVAKVEAAQRGIGLGKTRRDLHPEGNGKFYRGLVASLTEHLDLALRSRRGSGDLTGVNEGGTSTYYCSF